RIRAERERAGGADDADSGAAVRSARHFAAGDGARLSDRRWADGTVDADQWRIDGGAARRRRFVPAVDTLRRCGRLPRLARRARWNIQRLVKVTEVPLR